MLDAKTLSISTDINVRFVRRTCKDGALVNIRFESEKLISMKLEGVCRNRYIQNGDASNSFPVFFFSCFN